SAQKKVSLYPNLGSRRPGRTASKSARASAYYNAYENMITAAQLRAARGLLDWTRTDLAKAANISPETVKNIEHGTFRPQEQTADAIVRAFGAYDGVFTEDQGVRIKRDYVTKYEGDLGLRKFVDDIYDAAKDLGTNPEIGKLICVSNVDDRLFAKDLGDDIPV